MSVCQLIWKGSAAHSDGIEFVTTSPLYRQSHRVSQRERHLAKVAHAVSESSGAKIVGRKEPNLGVLRQPQTRRCGERTSFVECQSLGMNQ